MARRRALYEAILKSRIELSAADLLRYADALVHLNRPVPALPLYKQALVAGLNPEQEVWAQFQLVRLAHTAKRQDLAQGGLRSLSEKHRWPRPTHGRRHAGGPGTVGSTAGRSVSMTLQSY